MYFGIARGRQAPGYCDRRISPSPESAEAHTVLELWCRERVSTPAPLLALRVGASEISHFIRHRIRRSPPTRAKRVELPCIVKKLSNVAFELT